MRKGDRVVCRYLLETWPVWILGAVGAFLSCHGGAR